MIEEPPLLTVRRPTRRPTEAQIKALTGIPTGFVVDAMQGQGAMTPGITAMRDDQRVTGPALTAWNGPADLLGTLGAIHLCQDGDVIIAAVDGYLDAAAVGDRVCGMMKNAGAVALITDGTVRDSEGIEEVGLPVWCAGRTPNSPFRSGPGTVGRPVTMGGCRVEAGDMIVADRDGIVVVPFDRIDPVIGRLDRVKELEEAKDAQVAKGFKEPLADLFASDRVVWE